MAQDAIDSASELGIGFCSHEIVRGLALAEARLGEHRARMGASGALIEAQTELGVKGLQLGATYEACARIAIWAGERHG